MVDRDCLGATGQPFELVVELGKVREFAKATFSEHPELLSGECIPPTFLMVALHWQGEQADALKAARLDPQRTLHAGQEYIFHGEPPTVGTRLRGLSRIDRVYDKPGSAGTLTFVEVVTAFTDNHDRLVAETRMTAVETQASPKADGGNP
jgi:hydroxyacyl-ACP dehydratase HTD2-like protein with hotdog domain